MTTRRVLIISGGLCLGLAISFFFLGRWLLAPALAMWKFRNAPEAWMVPKPLLSDSAPHSPGPRLAYFGYEFESPIVEVNEERKSESLIILSFSGCAGLTIFKPRPAGELLRILQLEANGQDIKAVFGEEATRSQFALRSKTLNATPRDLPLFSSPEAFGTAALLAIKNVESQRFRNGLYSFESPWMHGFQEGDLSRDEGVVIDAFDKQDRELVLIIAARPGKSCFSQPELNRVLFSLKPMAWTQ